MKRKYRIIKHHLSDGSKCFRSQYRWCFMWFQVPYWLYGEVYYYQNSTYATFGEAQSIITSDKENRTVKTVISKEFIDA